MRINRKTLRKEARRQLVLPVIKTYKKFLNLKLILGHRKKNE